LCPPTTQVAEVAVGATPTWVANFLRFWALLQADPADLTVWETTQRGEHFAYEGGVSDSYRVVLNGYTPVQLRAIAAAVARK
jgi:hypothetical protein